MGGGGGGDVKLRALQSLYDDNRMCVRVGREESECFESKVGLRQGCMTSPWLFNIYMDGVVREVHAREGNGVELVGMDGQGWELCQVLFLQMTQHWWLTQRTSCRSW